MFSTLNTLALTVAALLLIRFAWVRYQRNARRRMSGLGHGARFRVLDAMLHAVWTGGRIDPERRARAREIARDTTDATFDLETLTRMARRCDRLPHPLRFYWMRKGLDRAEKLVIFNAALSVTVADGPLVLGDRVFLRHLARGLGLGRDALRNLGQVLIPPDD